jgi:hypothetical protein
METSFKRFSAEAMTTYAPEESRIIGKDHWRVMNSFRFYLGDKYSEQWVYVPRGYLTDGASVPRIFWGFLPPWGVYGQAAIVHDYLCEFLSITVEGQPVSITRKRCDEIFLEAMKVLGVPTLQRHAMFCAVSGYRIIAGINKPTSIPLRRQLEAAWLAKELEDRHHGCC